MAPSTEVRVGVRSRARRALAFPLVLGAVALLAGFRQDDLDCEQAVSHLASCCPGLDPHGFNCTYEPGCGQPVETQFSITQSQCIVNLDCATVISSGLCDSSVGATSNETVCPP